VGVSAPQENQIVVSVEYALLSTGATERVDVLVA
jgi:hypothetical protein